MSATPAPSNTPPSASENQWAFRYTREHPISRANPAAAHSQTRRLWPAGMKAMTRAMPIAAPATEWPDGYDGPFVTVRGDGGRPRSIIAFIQVSAASDTSHVNANAIA